MRSLWQLQLGNGSLDTFIFQSKTFDSNDLIAVSRSMQIGTKSNVVLECRSGEINDSLVEFVLLAASVSKLHGH
jgi:hypothetical protein